MIPKKELCALTVNLIFVKVILGFPRTVVENSGSAAWIQVIYNLAAALLIYYIIAGISDKRKSIIDILQIRWLRAAVGIIVSALLLVNLLLVVRSFPDEVRAAMLQEENKGLLMMLLTAASAAGAFLGIEAIARVSRLFLPVMVAIFIISAIFLIPKYNTDNLFPIFGLGADKIFISGTNTLSLFSDIIILDLLRPYAESFEDIRRAGRNAIIISGAGAVAVLLIYCLTYSYPISTEFAIPLYNMARLINLTSFFNRFEAFYEFVWTIIVLIHTSSYLFMTAHCIKTAFYIRNIKPVLVGVTAVLIAAAMIPGLDNGLRMIWMYSYIGVIGLMLIFGRKRREGRL